MLKTLFPQKLFDVSFTNPTFIVGSAAIVKLLITESNAYTHR
jgi:hypothetical protein